MNLARFPRLCVDADHMDGVPCIRGLRIPVTTVIRTLADGTSTTEVLTAYPDLEAEDVFEVLRFAADALEASATALDPREWYAVRCIFRTDGDVSMPELASHERAYEERVTLWRAESFDDAIALAESEAERYAKNVEADYLGLAQAYLLVDRPDNAAEVFSLMRYSALDTTPYLDRFFADGGERQLTDAPDST
jgi:uncharacterized protein (DUF433 family)